MTPEGSRNRLFLYIAIAMGTAINSGIQALPLDDVTKAWITFAVGVFMAGAVTARSFIDQSPSEVPKEDPEPEKKPYQIP